ncbi:MAG TPA: Gfo/Idh/MocA family oxidoreductase, partial [Alkalispirochaeta sp.]|nr:Gfo/Idh/MocA family oxidoreductase [Alkalispirochaeta sp.]
MKPIQIAFLGAGRRARYLYRRIIEGMPESVELVGVWSRSEASARQLGETLGVPWFTDMATLKSETGAVAGIVTVSYDANGVVGLEAVSHGLHILTETPIAHDLSEADQI